MRFQALSCNVRGPLKGRVRRKGASTLDFILVLCVIFPLGTFVFWAAPRIMNLVYEMLCVLVSWPFM